MLNVLASLDAAGWAAGLAGVGAGLCVLGAGIGIGNIGGNATQATARQPEASGQVFLQMLIAAALIEGVAFFGIITASGSGAAAITAAEEMHSADNETALVAPAEQAEYVIEEDTVH